MSHLVGFLSQDDRHGNDGCEVEGYLGPGCMM